MSEQPIVDFGFLEELSGGDSIYKFELLSIFLSTTPDGVVNLEQLVEKGKDYEAIYKQAHALKSSVGVIKIRDVHPGMAKIEALARGIHEGKDKANDKENKEEIVTTLNSLLETFNAALPLLEAERDKNEPKLEEDDE
ncbi:MAG: Hpt domain-containing protein [Flavipsychrobacter sp.]